MEKKTFKLMSQVINEIPRSKVAILSGPNFSSELINKKPSASVLSAKNESTLREISKLILAEKFKFL